MNNLSDDDYAPRTLRKGWNCECGEEKIGYHTNQCPKCLQYRINEDSDELVEKLRTK
jgi:hypothetical protein